MPNTHTVIDCPGCNRPALDGRCINPDCTIAAKQATPKDLGQPAAVTISGQVD